MFLRFRKLAVIGAGLALLVGLTTGSLAAASSTKKTYSATVTPATLDYATPNITREFTVTYTNTTPGGTSTINSIQLQAPAGYAIIANPTTAQPPTFTTNPVSTAGNLTWDSATITVTNLNPLTYSQSVTLDFWASIDTSTLSCSTAVGTWTTRAWTGSNTSGTLFTLSSAVPTTTIGTLASGATITVDGVTVTNNGACTPVTISRSADTVAILKPSGVAFTVDILWDPVLATAPMTTWTQVDTPSPTHDILWCSGTASAPTLPNSTEVSCLISETSQVYGPDASGAQQVQVKDHILLLGDIVWSR